ncbi:MAG: NADH:ubiquinone oxidoreductase subunit J [Pelagibacteraceae bacterium]|nr:NADH:ubiquinone oxidoreductase subunit J [Pelagibacteraceae bacterium]|tara:strand:+ start:8299 stop:8913 length:615 start_codon:yes stop_codon:yes gene_type:complete
MFIFSVIFYFFAFIIVASSIMVISSRDPIHSVLYLILSFVTSAILFVTLGAEFLAMILIVVYVGAVAVLFLFVVMMLDINFVKIKEGFLSYLPIALLISACLVTELIIIFISKNKLLPEIVNYSDLPDFSSKSNTKDIGNVLYTDYFYLFQISGLILLVAMIGSIVLTLRTRPGVKKQNIAEQVFVSTKSRIIKKKVPLRKGIK